MQTVPGAVTLALIGMLAVAALPGRMALAAPEETTEETAAPDSAPAVTVDIARPAPIEKRVPVSGSLVARERVLVYAKVSGHAVDGLLVDVGDHVQAGQVLATLQSDALSALLAQAEAEHERAAAGVKQAESQIASADATLTEVSATLERTRRLRGSGNTSQATLDQAIAADASARANADSARDGLSVARAALAQADAARRIARLDFDNARITAPVAGVVAQRNASLGELSGSAAQPMFTIIADGQIELAGEVIESAVAELVQDAPATLRIAGIGAISGRVRLLPAEVDPLTRLAIVRLRLDADPRLRTGLFASGWILLERREALTVPTTAILSDGSENHVQVVKDGVIETRPVTAGLIWDGPARDPGGRGCGRNRSGPRGRLFPHRRPRPADHAQIRP
ncbi:efflux RND transporter periplasmic adaptor subunit [Paracoccus sp. DMF-8]|uniref:efflux RND transporter periplasmic adaptor subunit n=1 Tax=Paracoccus sp. DMF-8 TaxID=3019445 RepID=UPI0023E8C342|nr:efflux RND transporter periplasmic adaptor subunit [Paracoccus sp. DMF-8]MDF3606068.1 efflux RND transporter periplasmic adaptor subunit [Paracoccus sp. DMF-8]